MDQRVLVWPRRLAAVVAVALVVLLGFTEPARAADGLTVPEEWKITAPSSALTGGSLDDASPEDRARAVGNVASSGRTDGKPIKPPRVPTTARTLVSKAGKAGPPMFAGATAFFLAFEGTSAVLSVAGVDNTGLEALFPTEFDPEFVPNEDASFTPPGWREGLNRNGRFSWGFNGSRWGAAWVTTQIIAAPKFLATGEHLLTYAVTADGECFASYNTDGFLGHQPAAFFRRLSPPYDQRRQTVIQTKGVGTPCGNNYGVRQATVKVPDGYAFDHLEIGPANVTTEPTIVWYPEGHELWTPGANGDPARVWETRWTCSTGATGSLRSDPFNESSGAAPEFPQATCDPGTPVEMEVWQITLDGTIDPLRILEWTPSGANEWAEQYPECTDGSCFLELERLDPTTGATVSCFASPRACLDWYTDPAKAETYRCTYGGNVVAIEQCRVYAPTFNVATDTPVKTDEGTRPASETHPYADPATGQPQPGTGGQPGTEPGSGTDPSLRCGGPPPFDFNVGGVAYWMVHGTMWVLCKAFMPQSMLNTADVTRAWNQTVFGWFGSTVGGGFEALGTTDAGRCGRIAGGEISAFGGRSIEINTCGQPWQSFAPVRDVLGWGFIVAATVGGLLTCLNTIRVKPTSGESG